MDEAVRQFDVVRVVDGACATVTDRIAAEVPLEVRLNGEPFSVIMRTPGADADLALGFLFTERVIGGMADVARVVPDPAASVVDVELSPARAVALPELLGSRRQVALNSSCGMCGRRSLASLDVGAPALAVEWAVEASVVRRLPAALGVVQAVFEATGGLHAAGLFDRTGRLDASAEDVGRHNAVDKLIGRMLRAGRLPLGDALLLVSGRSSFEIVQKALLAGVPFVAAVSAPSSLAIELARESGVTLCGFVRDGRFNVYAHGERVAASATAGSAVR